MTSEALDSALDRALDIGLSWVAGTPFHVLVL